LTTTTRNDGGVSLQAGYPAMPRGVGSVMGETERDVFEVVSASIPELQASWDSLGQRT
jgi:hypothetical protein